MPIRILILLLLLSNYSWAQNITGPQSNSAPLNITDGTANTYPYKLIVSPGTLTNNNDGTATLNTAGSSGNVGIGTTGRIPVYQGTQTIGSPYNNVMDSNGNIGIGSSTPGKTLDVQGSIRAINGTVTNTRDGIAMSSTAITSTNEIENQIQNGTGNLFYGVESSTGGNIFNGTLPYAAVFGNSPGFPTQLAAGNQARFTITSGGNVGIGSITPGAKFDIQGNTRIISGSLTQTKDNLNIINKSITTTSDVENEILNGTSTVVYGAESSTGGNVFNGTVPYAGVYGTSSSTPLQLATSNSARMTIDSSGNVGIGTSTPAGGFTVMNGNVGIGTWVPPLTLAVFGGISGSDLVQFKNVNAAGYTDNAFQDNNGTPKFYIGYGNASATAPWATRNYIQSMNNDFAILNGAGGNTIQAMFLANGTVGIGTFANPQGNILDVVGSNAPGIGIHSTTDTQSNAGRASFTLARNSQSETGWQFLKDVDDSFKFRQLTTGSVTRTPMVIDTTGNVGIGTSLIGGKLTVGDNTIGTGAEATNPGTIQIVTSNGNSATGTGGLEFKQAGGATGYGWKIAAPDLLSANTPLIILNRVTSASWTERMRITNAGNMGIGTSLPSSLLEVGTQRLNVLSGGNVGLGTVLPGGAFIVMNGNVGIGTNSPVAVTSTRKVLQIVDTTNDAVIRVTGSAADAEWFTNSSGMGFFNRSNTDLSLGTNNLDRFHILSGGNVGINSATPGATLDVTGTLRLNGTGANSFRIQAAANQACTTTCTTGKAIMGFDQGTLGAVLGSIVGPSDVTADQCLCGS